MIDSLKLYVIASRGFAARFRLDSILTQDRLSTKLERESIRRDMTDFCKGQGDPAPIPASLFRSLTELCRSIDVGEIVAYNSGNAPPNEESDEEAKWTRIKEYLSIQGEQLVDFEHHQETICQFIWCYVQRELVVPDISAPASTSSTSTSQESNAPPPPTPTPEPSHAEVSAAPTPRRNNMTYRAFMEDYES